MGSWAELFVCRIQRHIDRPMRIMADLLRRNRAPAEVVQLLAEEKTRLKTAMAGTGHNDRYP